MAIQTFELDPNAQALTDDDVITKINAATTDITRAGSVDPSARPIEVDEITSAEIAAGSILASDLDTLAARDNLLALGPTVRRFIPSTPISGEFPITDLRRNAAGNLEAEYDDVAIP